MSIVGFESSASTFYQDAFGMAACRTCMAGTFWENETTRAPTSRTLNQHQVLQTYIGCAVCAAGSFAATDESLGCTDCPVGQGSALDSNWLPTGCQNCAGALVPAPNGPGFPLGSRLILLHCRQPATSWPLLGGRAWSAPLASSLRRCDSTWFERV